MSIIDVRCPRCGSPSSSKTARDEYRCEHCGTTFHYVNTSRREVIHIDMQNCPMCGKPTQRGQTYACVECGRAGICPQCMSGIPASLLQTTVVDPLQDEKGRDVYVCPDCQHQFIERVDRALGRVKPACDICGSTEDIVECISCGRKYCGKHYYKEFQFNGVEYCCEACGEREDKSSNICAKCIDVKLHLFKKETYHCRKCGAELDYLYPPQ